MMSAIRIRIIIHCSCSDFKLTTVHEDVKLFCKRLRNHMIPHPNVLVKNRTVLTVPVISQDVELANVIIARLPPNYKKEINQIKNGINE